VIIGLGGCDLKLVEVALFQLRQSFTSHDRINTSLNALFMVASNVLVCRPIPHALTVTEIDSPGGQGRCVRPCLQLDGKMLDSCKILVRHVSSCELGVVMQLHLKPSPSRQERSRQLLVPRDRDLLQSDDEGTVFEEQSSGLQSQLTRCPAEWRQDKSWRDLAQRLEV
jgi:hypothetical protein